MEHFIIFTSLTFKEYFRLILKLRFRSIQLVWDLCWLFSIIYIPYLSYLDYFKNPAQTGLILKALVITLSLAFIYPLYIYFIYKKIYNSNDSLLKENIQVIFFESEIVFKTNFSENKIENDKINKIRIFTDFIIIDFYQNLFVINRKKLTKKENELTIKKVSEINFMISKESKIN